ncbi:glycosyltransferase family 4 protein [Aureimonas phyllosphaerae]|uniref:glycosyltransferase family 4 protein n=1 Tax=Aureimonas phyllosphaerae TaxID=1166078 RepID=UPI003A5BB1DE
MPECRRLDAAGPLRVCFPFVGDDVGGSHISALKLIQGFDRSQVEPVVVLQRTDGPLAAFLRREDQAFVGCPLEATLSPRNGEQPHLASFLGQTLPFLRRFIREGRFHIVHTNDGRIHANWGLAARLAGARLVWHHRGDPAARGVNRLAPLIANEIVTVSHFSRPKRPLLPLRDRLSVINSPFDPPLRSPDRNDAKDLLLGELGLPAGTRVLSYVGSLIERKRPLLFVEIVAQFRQRHPAIPIVGCMFGAPDPAGADLDAAVRARIEALGLQHVVRLMGFRSPMETFLAATDILLVPAFGEPLGRTLVEAMFLRTPVVATDHGGNPEAICDGRTGFLVHPESADAFIYPMARLLSDPNLSTRIADAAEAEAHQSYGSVRHVEQIMAVYARALRRPARSARLTGVTETFA